MQKNADKPRDINTNLQFMAKLFTVGVAWCQRVLQVLVMHS